MQDPMFDRSSFENWIIGNQDSFTEEERNNVAQYLGYYNLDHVQELKIKLEEQISFVKNFLNEAAKTGLDMPRLCEEYNRLEPILLQFDEKDCNDPRKSQDILTALMGIDNKFHYPGLSYAEKNTYNVSKYTLKKLMTGELPDDISLVDLSTAQNVHQLSEGYYIAKAKFTVERDGIYKVFSKSEEEIAAKSILSSDPEWNNTINTETCGSFYLLTLPPCHGEILLYKDYNGELTIFGAKLQLISSDMAERLLNSLTYRGLLTSNRWLGSYFAAADAVAKIAAGAALVQCYSGLVYRGPELIGECIAAIRAGAGA